MRKYVIIIGAMKSGTTTLFDMLARHPEIAPARWKEPGFFAFEDIWARGFDWFDGLFDFDPARHVYRLEASTDYTKAPFVQGVWERMTAQPDVEVRLIYLIRDPLRRLESHARHVQIAGCELGKQPSPRADHSLDHGLSAVNLATSSYAAQLDMYPEALAEGRLHCLTLEELKATPEASMARLWDFLDLAPPPETELLASNAAGPREQVRPTWHRLASLGWLMWLGRGLLPKPLRERIKGLFRQRVEAEGRFALTAQEEQALMQLYGPDLARLTSEYNVTGAALWTTSAPRVPAPERTGSDGSPQSGNSAS